MNWPEDPMSFRHDIIRAAIDRCKEDHEACRHTTTSQLKGFKLIHCQTREVMPAPAGCRYVALSYVWGNTKAKNSTSMPLLRHQAERTIDSAIVTALNLGYTWLWADRYCIDQSSKHVDDQINQMHVIYLQADLTIFAASGADANSGLPGVNKISREHGMIAEWESCQLFSPCQDMKVLVEDSVWNTRAWTYQEAVFSRRRLYFTQEQVFFEVGTVR
jgi:hypothetical protein